MDSQKVLEERKSKGVLKEFPLSSGVVLRVKMPSPKILDDEFYALRREVNKTLKNGKDEEDVVENGIKYLDFYLEKFSLGLQDGWTLDLLSPDEFTEVKEGILDFFGKTVKKDGTSTQNSPNGEIVSTDSRQD